jgi:DNA-binding transcriptional MerR regulator
MPRTKKVLNAFLASEVSRHTGLSMPMVDYLSREGFLKPAYGNPDGRRGKVRYYSYRDLVIARVIQRLRATGVELYRLKAAIQELNTHRKWRQLPADEREQVRWLLSDGKRIFIKNNDGFFDDVEKKQRAFAFIVNLDGVAAEMKRKVPKRKRDHWSIENNGLLLDDRKRRKEA